MNEPNVFKMIVYNPPMFPGGEAVHVLELEHGESAIGSNVVAVVQGRMCKREDECSWCRAISRRVQSRNVGVWT